MTDDPLLPQQSKRNFLDHYFASIYNKLEADALLFNRRLPHAGLLGSENETAIAAVLRDFLPTKYGIEVNALVIDRFGGVSRQADIVIYDSQQPKSFRKVFPVENVYAVIEVKTSLNSADARACLDNLASVSALEFRPALTPYWQTQSVQHKLRQDPPALYAFAYRTGCKSFETFARWIEWDYLHRGVTLQEEIRVIRACALDQGIIQMESSNGTVTRMLAEAGDADASRTFTTTLQGQTISVDPAKALFMFMVRLWQDLQHHALHPGFDIRSYMSEVIDVYMDVPEHFVFDGIAE